MYSDPTPQLRLRAPSVASALRTLQPTSDRLAVVVDASVPAIYLEMTARAPVYMASDFVFELIEAEQQIRRLVAVDRVRGRREPPFLVLCAARPETFCLGGDLKLFRETIRTGNRDVLAHYAQACCDLIWSTVTGGDGMGLTTVALVRGEAFGGGFEAALAAHLLVAERGASFAFPEALFGLFPGMGAEPLLRSRVDIATARNLVANSRIWTAEQLHAMGIVDVLVAPGEGHAYVRRWMQHAPPAERAALRERFSAMSLRELYATVERWVDCAMALDGRHLRAIDYIIAAQQRRLSVDRSAGAAQSARMQARVYE